MKNDIKIFEHEDFGKIRVIEKDGELWFYAKEPCTALSLGNVSKAVASLDDDEKGITSSNTLGGKQDVTIVSEAGLYSLILRSRKKEAKAFKRWVTHEVLPTIRKHGAYMTGDLMAQIKANPRAIGELLINLANEEEKREELEAREEIWGTRTPYGEISKRTGKPRTHIVRGYPRSRRDETVYTITTITETQLRLFNPYGYDDN